MAYRTKSGKYEFCPDCGAHLDHGEKCDCIEQDRMEGMEAAESRQAGYPLHI